MKSIVSLLLLILLSGVVVGEAISVKPRRLANKVSIITGASRGIGRAIAQVFSEEGATVILVSRSEKPLASIVKTLRAQGAKADYVVADLSQMTEVRRMVDQIIKDYGRIDVLIHNAGIYPVSRIENMSFEEWHTVLNTNLSSAFYLVQACLPVMKQQESGRIVFTSSISGPRVGLPGASHYTASKGGLDGFMKTIAIELAPHHITVNAVEPGNIMTEGYAALSPEHIKNMRRAVPLGRLGTPEEVAYAHLFLASDEARYITGQSIIVDGGQLLPESHFLDYAGP